MHASKYGNVCAFEKEIEAELSIGIAASISAWSLAYAGGFRIM